MKIFISGGCKNGKSHYAVKIAALLGTPLYYMATMVSSDAEDDERIVRHQKEREGLGFITLELAADINRLPEHCDLNGSYLLDSLTALLANEMFINGEYVENAYEKVIRDASALINKTRNIVVVSDNIYSDAFLYDEMTENYRRSLGIIDRAAADLCDVVLEITFGGIIVHKDTKGFSRIYEKIS